ncbi:MAG: MgtC/SapB family protein [Planctomycetes bacterium]|nr:MgtC/SapB family protein [Planctomycetota bacterium]
MWNYLVDDWWGLLGKPWAPIVLALVAVFCGALVGTERERKEKPAGVRTLVLVSLGSATFTMISFAFTTTTGDSGRVAAQIVTGIGFLGAGVILHGASGVSGTTTAATVWMTAATGMTVGAGYGPAGVALSLLTRLALTGIHGWEARAFGPMRKAKVELAFAPDHGKARVRIEKLLEDFHVHQVVEHDVPAAEGAHRMTIRFEMPRRHSRDFLYQLACLPEVRELDCRDEA